MPVAQQQHHHHHSHSSVFSSLNSIFHGLHHPAPPSPSSPLATFDSSLSLRLTSLLPPDGASFLSLPSMSLSLDVLLAAHSELTLLVPSPAATSPISPNQSRIMNEFLDRSPKLLDSCNSVKEQIAAVQGWLNLVDVVLLSLGANKQGSVRKGHFRRAQKALAELQFLMEIEREEGGDFAQLHRSFRVRHREAGHTSHEPQRWSSWPCSASSSHSHPSSKLQAVGACLTPPKFSGGDVDEDLCAAIYAFNVVLIFFLSTMMAAFPSVGNSYIVSFAHPRSFPWASPLSHLQEKAQEEIRRRGKKSGNGSLLELGEVFLIVKKLSQVTESVLSSDEFPLSDSHQEEIRNLVKQLRQYAEELDRDLKILSSQITELYRRLISSRMRLLDRFSQVDV